MPELPPVVLRTPAGTRPFRVGRRPPGPGLAEVVEHFWFVEWALPPDAGHDQEVVSDPCGHLTVEADGGWLVGVTTSRFRRRLRGAGRVVGAHLRPGALSALTDLPPAALADTRVPLATAMPAAPAPPPLADLAATPDPGPADRGAARAATPGSAAGGAEAGLDALEAWLAAIGPRRRPGAELVDAAVDLAAARPDLTRVAALAAELAVPVRTLQRRFDRHLGVGPKWVLRRCRIQDALGVIEAGGDVDWAALAADLGFADQSHFTNAFTALVGVPPGAYRDRPQR